MIHREKNADGTDVFHAYALRNEGHGYEMIRVGTFPTSDAAKDAVAPDLEKQLGAFVGDLKAFELFLAHEGWDRFDCDEFQIDLIRAQATRLHETGYYISVHSESLFKGSDSACAADGVSTLYGPAAVEYARRHGYPVTHAKFNKAGNHEFKEQVTAGRAFELLPTIDGNTYLSIKAPRDLVPNDLPPDISPFDLRDRKAVEPESLRESAASSRRIAERLHARMMADAAELDRLADLEEAGR